MLVLTRRVSQSIQIGEEIVVTVLQIGGNKVRIGIEAPAEVHVLRSELQLEAPAHPSDVVPSSIKLIDHISPVIANAT
jgi:carbon storage regulator